LFLQRTGNRSATKPYPSGTYTWVLRQFSDIVQVTDSKGRPVRLSHTHRFRHTKLTRLAELGLPIHVLQRYAGHATPTMSMHYIAQRDEHAEQAFVVAHEIPQLYAHEIPHPAEAHVHSWWLPRSLMTGVVTTGT